MPTIDNWRALRDALDAGPAEGKWDVNSDALWAYLDQASPAAIRSLLDERDRLEKALALVQQHHATAWNRGHTIGMAAQEETARKALDAVKADAWGNAQLTEALLAAEAERDRLTAEQQVLRQWIAEVLPVLGSIDSEGECHALDFIVSHQLLRSLVESGRRLVDGGPDDLLAGVE